MQVGSLIMESVSSLRQVFRLICEVTLAEGNRSIFGIDSSRIGYPAISGPSALLQENPLNKDFFTCVTMSLRAHDVTLSISRPAVAFIVKGLKEKLNVESRIEHRQLNFPNAHVLSGVVRGMAPHITHDISIMDTFA
jgi:hypothetical protein